MVVEGKGQNIIPWYILAGCNVYKLLPACLISVPLRRL